MTEQEITRSRFLQRLWQSGTRIFIGRLAVEGATIYDLKTAGEWDSYFAQNPDPNAGDPYLGLLEVKPGEDFAWIGVNGQNVVAGVSQYSHDADDDGPSP